MVVQLNFGQPEPIKTRRIRGSSRVDIYAMAHGGRLYVPVVPAWEREQQRRERAKGCERHARE